MSEESAARQLFDRWFRVWREDRYDLVPECLAPTYTRHGSYLQGNFTVSYTPEEYARVLATERERFKTRFTIQDEAFVGDRAWFRLTLYRTDPDTGRVVTRPAIQVYRIEGGKMVETWVGYQSDGTVWPDTPEAP